MASSNPENSPNDLGDDSQRDERSQDSSSSKRGRARSRRSRTRDLSTQFELGEATLGSGGKPNASTPSDSPVAQQPSIVPPLRYVSMGEVGRGGWGVVERAVDRQLSREVAVKRFTDESDVTEEERQRFLREAKVTSQLQHPGIVPVHEMGDREDTFYVMKLLDGITLSDYIERVHRKNVTGKRQTRFQFGESLEPLLQRFVDVCNAVAYAHERGIIHRDLKPANVMIGEFGETVVLDWGLAQSDKLPQAPESAVPCARSERHFVDSMTELSATVEPDGTVLGTPAYMSPEQAAGEVSVLNRSSDIYSLGVILFTVIAGRHPYHGQTLRQILEQVKNADYPALRSLQPLTPSPLEAIVRKAMSAKQVDRYSSAEQLASDVRRFIAGDSVSVYEENAIEKAIRWCRHHQGISATIAISASLLFCASVVFGIVVKQSHRAEQRARIQAEKAHRETILSLGEARDATDTWLLELSGSLQFYPGMAPLRKELLERAIGQYDRIASQNLVSMAEAESTESVKQLDHPKAFGERTNLLAVLEQVRTHLRLGDLYRLTSRHDDARKHYRHAEQLVHEAQHEVRVAQPMPVLREGAETAEEASAENLWQRFELEKINALTGHLLMSQHSPVEAVMKERVSQARQWLTLATEALNRNANQDLDPQLDPFVARVASAFVRLELAVWQANAKDTNEEQHSDDSDFEAAVRLARELARLQDTVSHRRLSETIQTQRCQSLTEIALHAQAVKAWSELVADLEGWLTTNSDRIDYMQSLAHARLQRGNCLVAMQDLLTAKADFESSIALLEEAWRRTDDDGFYRVNLATAENNLGQLLVRQPGGDHQRAQSLLDRSLETYESLLQDQITVDWLRRYATTHQALATLPGDLFTTETEYPAERIAHAQKSTEAFTILKDYETLTPDEELGWMRAELLLAKHYAVDGQQDLLAPRLLNSQRHGELLADKPLSDSQRQSLESLLDELEDVVRLSKETSLIHKTDIIEPTGIQ